MEIHRLTRRENDSPVREEKEANEEREESMPPHDHESLRDHVSPLVRKLTGKRVSDRLSQTSRSPRLLLY